MDKNLLINKAIEDNIRVKKDILENNDTPVLIDKIAKEIIHALENDKKILLCGNGGSFADAQHMSAELLGKFYLDREPIFAEVLSTNLSYLTAVANDYSYEEIFSREVRAKGREGDILIGISTSGNSKNVIKALEAANKLKMITVGLTGKDGGRMEDFCKYLVRVPSNDTPRIQEAHILIAHIICEIVEKKIFRS